MLLTEWNWDNAKEVWQEEAHEEGLQKGLMKGREEGLQKGLEEGREKGILEIARKMKEIGDSSEKIQAVTGLSLKIIEQIE